MVGETCMHCLFLVMKSWRAAQAKRPPMYVGGRLSEEYTLWGDLRLAAGEARAPAEPMRPGLLDATGPIRLALSDQPHRETQRSEDLSRAQGRQETGAPSRESGVQGRRKRAPHAGVRARFESFDNAEIKQLQVLCWPDEESALKFPNHPHPNAWRKRDECERAAFGLEDVMTFERMIDVQEQGRTRKLQEFFTSFMNALHLTAVASCED